MIPPWKTESHVVVIHSAIRLRGSSTSSFELAAHLAARAQCFDASACTTGSDDSSAASANSTTSPRSGCRSSKVRPTSLPKSSLHTYRGRRLNGAECFVPLPVFKRRKRGAGRSNRGSSQL